MEGTAFKRSARRRIPPRRWLLVAPSLLLFWIVGQIDKTNVSLIITDSAFLSELHLAGHHAVLGGLMSAFFAGYGISVFVWGFLVDRFGPRTCAICGSLAWGLMIFLSSRVHTIDEYLLVRFLLGFAEGNLWPVSNTLTNHWFPASEHGRAQSFWATGVTLGTAGGVPVVSALMLAHGWRSALVWLAVLSLIPIAIVSFVRDWPDRTDRVTPAELQGLESDRNANLFLSRMSLAQILRNPSFWLIMVCQIAGATTVYTMVQWIPSYLIAIRHISFQDMGRWITAGYSLATILTLGIGCLADRTMQRSLAAASASLLFAAIIVPGAFLLSPFQSAIVLSALIAVPSATAALNGALLYTFVRPDSVARATGIYIGTANIISSFGPAFFGVLINATGGQFVAGFFFLTTVNLAGTCGYVALHHLSRSPEQSLAAKKQELV